METAGRRVEKFAKTMQSVSIMQSDYETKMKQVFFFYHSFFLILYIQLIDSINKIQTLWGISTFDDSYADAKLQSLEFNDYKKTLKRDWVKEKLFLESLMHDIQTKLKSYCLKNYIPPKGLELNDLDITWKGLIKAEVKKSRQINEKIRE